MLSNRFNGDFGLVRGIYDGYDAQLSAAFCEEDGGRGKMLLCGKCRLAVRTPAEESRLGFARFNYRLCRREKRECDATLVMRRDALLKLCYRLNAKLEEHLVDMLCLVVRSEAINKDEDAPIFDIANVGIVGNVLDVLPLMIEEIKKARA